MAKFKLDEKNTEYIEISDIYEVEHKTEKAYLIKNQQGFGEWIPKIAIKIEGKKISVAKWMYEKAEIFQV
jgi:hypothetical protein